MAISCKTSAKFTNRTESSIQDEAGKVRMPETRNNVLYFGPNRTLVTVTERIKLIVHLNQGHSLPILSSTFGNLTHVWKCIFFWSKC